MFEYFWIPAFAFAACVIAILLVRPIAVAADLVDRPGGRKRHEGVIPLVGGIGITLALALMSAAFVRPLGIYAALLGGILLLVIVGMMDDLRGVSPMIRLAVQFFAAILMTSWGGVYLTSLGDLLGHREIALADWSIPLTLLAALAVINAMNMSDGLDGLAGGLAFFMFAWFAVIAGDIGNLMAQRICLIFCGAILGFLLFNLPHRLRHNRLRVFLGDAGSLTLGYGIVWFAVQLSQGQYNGGKSVPPVVLLWVAGFLLIDLLAVVARRVVSGRNPLSADRTHLHHILLRMNSRPGLTVAFILASNVVMGLIGVMGWRAGVPESVLFLAFLVLTAVHLCIMHNAARFLRRGRRWFARGSKLLH
ncbi:MraY family glycosyltransferase [Cupriavidus sp. BIC8F]|uniref:MraY family glycosyltransferase n=1 Tax=Cupriavidus sp. BIC8F TaxID=3079014 RepID=UPI002916D71A|nr:MraY family glycosyltransferase [Cupriavidus sp. BIC8F]